MQIFLRKHELRANSKARLNVFARKFELAKRIETIFKAENEDFCKNFIHSTHKSTNITNLHKTQAKGRNITARTPPPQSKKESEPETTIPEANERNSILDKL